jgi:regulatory protein
MTQERRILNLNVKKTRMGTRVIVAFDRGDPIELDPEIVTSHRLRRDMAVDDALLETLGAEDERLRARRRLTRYLSLRVKSVAEARAYLEKAGFGEAVVESTIEDALQRELLDDRRFAERFIRTRLKTSPHGPLRLLVDLKAHGIDEKLAEDVLASQFDRDWQLETAEAVARKRMRRVRDKDARAAEKRLYDWLMRRGFDGDVAREVARRVAAAPDDEPMA